MRDCRSFLSEERGATAIEYTLIAALIAVALLASINGLGGSVASAWNDNIVPTMIDALT